MAKLGPECRFPTSLLGDLIQSPCWDNRDHGDSRAGARAKSVALSGQPRGAGRLTEARSCKVLGTVGWWSLFLLSLARYTKPLTFADCISDELPLGWEEAYDPQVGDYFIDHNTSKCLAGLPSRSCTSSLYLYTHPPPRVWKSCRQRLLKPDCVLFYVELDRDVDVDIDR